MKGVFDIVGPIMIGPSSSHTAGAVRLGMMAGKILGERVVRADIKLHGSFAQTYKGHGTDKALLAGIMGFNPDDERIRNALLIARERGIECTFSPVDIFDAHPNTALLELVGEKGRKITVQGASIGGGNIMISKIGSFSVHLTGRYPALVVIHIDKPGVINKITGILAKYSINVAFMSVSRKVRGQEAMMILETDEEINKEVVDECCFHSSIMKAFAIPSI